MLSIPKVLLFLLLSLNLSVFSQTVPPGYKNLTAAEFKDKSVADKNKILLDVRTPEEFKKGHLNGAININFFDPGFQEQIKSLEPGKAVYVYCAVGGRSAKASVLLSALNNRKVYNLAGGLMAWQKANFPVQQ